MKKWLVVLGFMPLVSLAQQNGQSFKLSGQTGKLFTPASWVYLQYRTDGSWKTDSAQVKNGSYTFTGFIDEPGVGRLRINYQDSTVKHSQERDRGTIFLQPGKMKIQSVDSFSNFQVKGSLAHTEYLKLVEKAKPYDVKMGPLFALYTQFNRAKENAARDRVEKMIDSLDADRNNLVYGAYVKQNPNSPIALFALQQYAGYDIDADKLEPVFNSLSPTIRNYPSGKTFSEALEIAKKTGIGKMAMDFTQNDTLDQPVSLSSLKGKYLLIDFWASWCGPCRAENPNVVKVFNKFKDKGFHVLGVSLDRPGHKDRWIKAIHDDQLTWTQVSDLKFWENEVAKQYGIRAIPQNLLLDPTGKIIAKNIRGEELEKKVAEALEQKAF